MTSVRLRVLSKIIKESKDVPYEDYSRKRSNHIPTASYLYL